MHEKIIDNTLTISDFAPQNAKIITQLENKVQNSDNTGIWQIKSADITATIRNIETLVIVYNQKWRYKKSWRNITFDAK